MKLLTCVIIFFGQIICSAKNCYNFLVKLFAQQKNVTNIGEIFCSAKKCYNFLVKLFVQQKNVTNIGQIICSTKQYKEIFIFYLYI